MEVKSLREIEVSPQVKVGIQENKKVTVGNISTKMNIAALLCIEITISIVLDSNKE